MKYVIGCFVFGFVMLIFGIACSFENATVGIIGIVVGIVSLLVVIIPLVYGIKKRRRDQEELCRSEDGIQQIIGADENEMLRKYGIDFDELEAEFNIEEERKVQELEKEEEFNSWLIQQGFAVSSATNDFLIDSTNKKWCKKFDKKIFDFSNVVDASINKHRSSSSSANYRYDTSTYEVLIKTNNINAPLLTINCKNDKEAAEKICATVDIMRGTKKRIVKNTENN